LQCNTLLQGLTLCLRKRLGEPYPLEINSSPAPLIRGSTRNGGASNAGVEKARKKVSDPIFTQKHQRQMDDADSGLESRTEPVYDPVRGQDASALTETPFTQNSVHAQIFIS
jgi:hypothetical protein